jgi:hypothetical protein
MASMGRLFWSSILETYPLFEKLLSLESGKRRLLSANAGPAIKRGDRAEIDSIIAKLERFSPDHTGAWAAIAPRAFLDDDSAMQKEIISASSMTGRCADYIAVLRTAPSMRRGT